MMGFAYGQINKAVDIIRLMEEQNRDLLGDLNKAVKKKRNQIRTLLFPL